MRSAALGDVPAVGDDAGCGHRARAARLPIIPDRHRTTVVTPENVVVTIAVKVADACDMRRVRHGTRIAGDLAIVPDRNRTVVVLPENVVVPVAVEVPGADDMPA